MRKIPLQWRRSLVTATALTALAVSAQATTIYSGTMSIASNDPTQLGRLFRNGVPQTWAGTEAFPGLTTLTTSYHYRTLDLDLSALQTGYVYGQYLQVIVDSPSVTTFLAGYLNTYNPTSAATVQSTWLGDPGLSGLSFGNPMTFQVSVNSGNHLLLVLNESTTNGGLNQAASIIVEAYSDTQYTDLVSSVPEPGSWLLMSSGVAGLLWSRRRRAVEPA